MGRRRHRQVLRTPEQERRRERLERFGHFLKALYMGSFLVWALSMMATSVFALLYYMGQGVVIFLTGHPIPVPAMLVWDPLAYPTVMTAVLLIYPRSRRVILKLY